MCPQIGGEWASPKGTISKVPARQGLGAKEMRARLTVLKMTKSHGNVERALGFGQKGGWRA